MSRTYGEILIELKQFVKQRWPNWNTEAKHIGNILLECLADQIEKQEYQIEAVENELFPDTSTKYESLLRWARLVGYEVQSAQPAEVTLTFSVQEAASVNIPIPIGTKVSTSGPDPIPYITTAAAVIVAGQTSVDVLARQGEEYTNEFMGTGEANQVYQTTEGNVWIDDLKVDVNGQRWTKVYNFLTSGSTDTHYRAEIQDDGSVLVIFGDGVNGKAPASGANITIRYITTRGEEGNVPAGAISVIDSIIYDANGYLADVRVTNNESASGGEDQEDISHLRMAIPAWISSSTRCVTKNDFIQVVGSIIGVARVLVQTKDDDETIPALTVKIYVVPEEGGEPTQVLIDRIVEEITVNRPKLLTVAVDVSAPTYLTIDVSCEVTVASGYPEAEVLAEVENKIYEFFSYSRKESDGSYAIDFGKPVYLARLIAWIMEIPGVANVNFTSPTGNVIPPPTEIPALGTVTVNAAA